MKLTAEEKQFFRERDFIGPTDFSVAKTERGRTYYVQFRSDGWRAVRDRADSNRFGWVSDPFPDPISCYVNAELVGWKE